MAINVFQPYPNFFDVDGSPLESGYIYIGQVGLNPLIEANRVSVYTDSTLAVPIPQPIRTLGGYPVSIGKITKILARESNYSILVTDKNGSLVYSSLNDNLFTVTYSITPAEIAELVMDDSYKPGHILRYYSGSGNYIAATQAAINTGHKVIVPNGTHEVANILYKTGMHMVGESDLAILKLIDNATVESYNGGVADGSGYYPANIIGSTLNHDGGVYSDGGTRALNEENSEYIFKNVTIENLTLDGNKANNAVGDFGQNRSAMGACVSIHQCKNVKVRKCRLINARLDGVHLGYSLHGGSDHCSVTDNWFEGNQRTNIAQVTGKHNTFHNNKGTPPTGGTGVTAGPGVDIEANLTGEVNFRHTVTANKIGGSLSIVCGNVAKLWGTVCQGNHWTGQLKLYGSGQTEGCVIDGDVFTSLTGTDNWLFRAGENVAGTDEIATHITNVKVKGYARVMDDVAGCVDNLKVSGSEFHVEAFGELTRGYKVLFDDNEFYLTGNSDTETIYLSNTLGGTVTNQGQIQFTRNRFFGVANDSFLRINRDTSWTVSENDYLFEQNKVYCTGMDYMFNAPTSLSVRQNLFTAWKPVNIAGVSKFIFEDNTAIAASAADFYANQSSTAADIKITRNKFNKVTLNLIRPKDHMVTYNEIIEGAITIVYSFTSAGIGRNHITHNTMRSTSGIASPFVVTTGSSFSTGDFAANDQYWYNVAVGYAGAASIDAAIAGKYDGTFV